MWHWGFPLWVMCSWIILEFPVLPRCPLYCWFRQGLSVPSCSVRGSRLPRSLCSPSKRACPHLIWIKGWWYLIAQGLYPFKSVSLGINFERLSFIDEGIWNCIFSRSGRHISVRAHVKYLFRLNEHLGNGCQDSGCRQSPQNRLNQITQGILHLIALCNSEIVVKWSFKTWFLLW